MSEKPASEYGPTELRAVLAMLLSYHGRKKFLTPWQLRVARLRVSQAHYTTYERKQIFRIVLEHARSGAIDAARESQANANSPENHREAGKRINHHAGYGSNKTGNVECPACGGSLHYHIGNGILAGVCEHRGCLRIISPEIERECPPRFINIVPQDIGTFLVESMNPRTLGTFYGVDVVEQTCTCDAWKFNPGEGCKHVAQVSRCVFGLHAF